MRFVLSVHMILMLPSLPVWAADLSSPVGFWKTIDDNSDKPGGLVRIELVDGYRECKKA